MNRSGQGCWGIDEHHVKHMGDSQGSKWYLRNATKGENVYDDYLLDAIDVDPESFANFIVRHLDEAL